MYDTWATAQNGPLTRRGVSFPTTDAELLADFDGITVAEDGDGRVVGYASWDRGQHYDERGTLEVSDLLAVSADGYRALLRTLGSFSSVAPRTKIDTSGDDLIRQFLPGRDWETVSSDPYMLAIIDVPGALSRRAYPWFLSARLGFRVAEVGANGSPTAARIAAARTAGRSPRGWAPVWPRTTPTTARSIRGVWPCCTPGCNHARTCAGPVC